MKWHPDRNPGDKSSEVRFKEINEAYEILKDLDKRAAYDRFGHAAFEHAGPGAAGGFGDVASAFADIFDDLFGMGGGRRGRGGGRVRGGPAGDLYIFLAISAHPFFQREGADLHCRVPISMVLGALGGEIEVPTIDGNHSRVKVPEGAQSGRRFRLQGKGMPALRSKQFGDMYIQVLVETPQKLSKRQRELLTEFERLSSQETQPETAGFFGRVKEFLSRSGAA